MTKRWRFPPCPFTFFTKHDQERSEPATGCLRQFFRRKWFTRPFNIRLCGGSLRIITLTLNNTIVCSPNTYTSWSNECFIEWSTIPSRLPKKFGPRLQKADISTHKLVDTTGCPPRCRVDLLAFWAGRCFDGLSGNAHARAAPS